MKNKQINRILKEKIMRKFRVAIVLSFGFILAAASITALLATSVPAYATGDASFSLSSVSGSYTVGSTFTVTVLETSSSSDNVEGVQANLTYNAANLQFNSVAESGSPFTICGQSTGGSGSVAVGCASTSTVSGVQTVAQISFTALQSGTGTVSFASGSDIQNSASTSVWNGSLPSANYSLTTPTPPVVTPTPTSTSSSTTSAAKTTTSAAKSTVAAGTTTKTGATTTTATAAPTMPITPTTPAKPVSTSTVTTADSPPLGTLTLVVTNSQGKPIANAKVIIGTLAPHYTNASGTVTFSSVKTGSNTVTVSYPGKATSKKAVLVTAGNIKLLSVKLAPASHMGEIITIVIILLVIAGVCWFLLHRAKKNQLPSSTASTFAPITTMNNPPPVSPSPSVYQPVNTQLPPTAPVASSSVPTMSGSPSYAPAPQNIPVASAPQPAQPVVLPTDKWPQ
jgi:hypothetical protein